MTPKQAEKYVAWNKLDRHLLIVAIMTQVEAIEEYEAKLADALSEPKHRGLSLLVSQACERLRKTI